MSTMGVMERRPIFLRVGLPERNEFTFIIQFRWGFSMIEVLAGERTVVRGLQ